MLLEVIDSGWLVPPQRRRLTPNRNAAGAAMVAPIEACVWHYTASGATAGTIAWLCDPAARASAHFVVGRDGEVWQLAPLTDRTWHAGGSASRLLGRGNVNGRSVGVEVVNWGPLRRGDGGRLLPWAGRAVEVETTEVDGRLWDAYPEAQIRACETLASVLSFAEPALADPARHVGHQDVDPRRKIDPGPHWPWERIRAAVRRDRA
jgi:N-acetylmuramoyl-L-alanine amidase